MATITSTSTSVIVSGTYKSFTAGTSTSTVIQVASGDAPAGGDSGRFLLWQNTADTGNWEIRYIQSATSTSVTITDGPYSSAPPAGASFVISTNFQDMADALPDTVMITVGLGSKIFDRDFSLTNGAFLADEGKSLGAIGTSASSFAGTYPMDDGTAFQLGRLIGGEANDSVETVGGCALSLQLQNNNSLMFTRGSVGTTTGPILNFYGCLVTSTSDKQMFIRSPGPFRAIGCNFDGPMGGRLYSTASELVSTRFAGNESGGVAWSLGEVFTRDISDAFFFQNNTAIKAFGGFSGVFKDVTFADSNTWFINSASATATLQFDFIDCTTFPDSAITANNGNYEQLKSINFTMNDATGNGLSGVNLAVYDNVGDIQGAVETSSLGSIPTVNARFFRKDHGAAAVNKFPFDIRTRKYGYNYLDVSSTVDEPVKQEVRLNVNPNVVATEIQAAAITGIALDFVAETVTITEATETQELYDYYQYELAQASKMQYGEDWVLSGDQIDLDDWDLTLDGVTYTGDLLTSGTINVINGGEVLGEYTDQNGTVIPPQTYSVSNIVPGSRLRVYNETTATEFANEIIVGTSYTGTYAEATTFSDGGRYHRTPDRAYQAGVHGYGIRHRHRLVCLRTAAGRRSVQRPRHRR